MTQYRQQRFTRGKPRPKLTPEDVEVYCSKKIAALNVPKSFYKFRYWHCGHQLGFPTKDCKSCQRQRLILTGPAVWFASSDSFNDPFDCKIPPRWDLLPEEVNRDRLTRLARWRETSLSEDEIKAKVDDVLKNHPVLSKDAMVRAQAWDRYAHSLAESYGILSLSGVCDPILLWSHYADAHRGYCVELDAHMLAHRLFDLFRTDDLSIDMFRVEYVDTFPTVLPAVDDLVDLQGHISLLTTKSDSWCYEKEWRFIWIDKTRAPLHIDKPLIRRVILGCQMPENHRKELVDLVTWHLPKTEIWEAVRSRTRFELEFRPLDISQFDAPTEEKGT